MPSEAARRPRQRHRKSTGGKGTTKGETPGEASRTRRPRRVAERGPADRDETGQAGKAAENGRTERKEGRAGGGTQSGEGSPRPRRWRRWQVRVTSPTTMGVASGGALAVLGVTAGREGRTRRGGASGAFRTPSAQLLPPHNLPTAITCPPRLLAGTEWKERERLRAGTALLDWAHPLSRSPRPGLCHTHPGYGQIFLQGPSRLAFTSRLAGGHDVTAGNCVNLLGSVQYMSTGLNILYCICGTGGRQNSKTAHSILLLR